MMITDTKRLANCMYGLEKFSKQLALSLEDIQREQEKANEILLNLLEALSSVRAVTDNTISQAQVIWQQFVRVADRCFAVENCPKEIRELLITAFSDMGYEVYGLPGTIVEDLGSVNVIAKQDSSSQLKGTVLQTLQVGLRRKEGGIVRFAKVTLSG